MIALMTFEQFQATGYDCADLGEVILEDALENVPGRVYVDVFYIERLANGQWNLLLERDEWQSETLEPLERKLYDYAVSEGY